MQFTVKSESDETDLITLQLLFTSTSKSQINYITHYSIAVLPRKMQSIIVCRQNVL